MDITALERSASLLKKNDPEIQKRRLEEAASQFESIFINQMLKEALPEENDADAELFGQSNAMGIYKSMFYQAMADEMAQGGGFGIRDLMMQQYKDLYQDVARNAPKQTQFDGGIISGEYKITSEFGFRDDPFSGKNKFHYGMDLAAPEGSPVKVPVSGKVVVAENQNGYGNCIKIVDESGNTLVFGHLQTFNVQPGDEVAAGQVIGTVGSTGRSTGPHLHFEVRNADDQAVDPRKMFSFNESEIKLAEWRK